MSVEEIVNAAIEKVKTEKRTYQQIIILEEALDHPDIKRHLNMTLHPDLDKEVKKNIELSKKIDRYHQIIVRTMAKELTQLSTILASHLTHLNSTSIKEDCPRSHTNITTVFDNTAHFLVDDIVSATTEDMRLKRLQRWITIANYCLKQETHDYHTAAAICAGLNNAAVGRLQTTLKRLSDENNQTLHDLKTFFLVDQGWEKMVAHLNNNESFIPHLGGIKKTLTKAEEAKKTHHMELEHRSDLLKKQGKIPSSSQLPLSLPVNTTTKATTIKQLTTTIEELKNEVAYFKNLTALQQQLTGVSQLDNEFTALTSGINTENSYQKATEHEINALRCNIALLQQDLLQKCNALFAIKKPTSHEQALMAILTFYQFSSLLRDPALIDPMEYAPFKQALEGLVTTQQTTKKSKHKLNKLLPAQKVPYATTLLTITQQMDELHTRLARLRRESLSRGSMISVFSSLSHPESTASLTDSDLSQSIQHLRTLDCTESISQTSTNDSLSQSAPSVKSETAAATSPRPVVIGLFRTQSNERLKDAPPAKRNVPPLQKANSYRTPGTIQSHGEALSPKGKPLLRRANSSGVSHQVQPKTSLCRTGSKTAIFDQTLSSDRGSQDGYDSPSKLKDSPHLFRLSNDSSPLISLGDSTRKLSPSTRKPGQAQS